VARYGGGWHGARSKVRSMVVVRDVSGEQNILSVEGIRPWQVGGACGASVGGRVRLLWHVMVGTSGNGRARCQARCAVVVPMLTRLTSALGLTLLRWWASPFRLGSLHCLIGWHDQMGQVQIHGQKSILNIQNCPNLKNTKSILSHLQKIPNFARRKINLHGTTFCLGRSLNSLQLN
jgi:hypothetical protein